MLLTEWKVDKKVIEYEVLVKDLNLEINVFIGSRINF